MIVKATNPIPQKSSTHHRRNQFIIAVITERRLS